MTAISNLFAGIAPHLPQEQIDRLHESGGVRIERIVSRGQQSPLDFWYDQPADEWVLVIRGAGRLRFEGVHQPRELVPGDFVYIPAHVRHRVEWTDPTTDTIWLAVHVLNQSPSEIREA